MANILVIDANSDDRKVLITLLSNDEDTNDNLFVAIDTTQALDIIHKEKLDLIIGNILILHSGDYELIKTLCFTPLLNIPVIFFNPDNHTSELIRLVKASGVVDIITDETVFAEKILKQVDDIISQKKVVKLNLSLNKRLKFNNAIIKRKKEKELPLQCQSEFASIATMSGIRDFACILSHELSQPLMVISAYVSGCIRRLEENIYNKKQIINALKTVNEHIDAAGKLLHHRKDTIPKIELHYENVNVHRLIKNTVSLLTCELHHFSVDIQYKFTKNLPLIELDVVQIKLVIFYLLKNAIEEMFEAKTKQPMLVIGTQINANNTISVSFKDNGRGIPAEIQNKLFNSCYTTKPKNFGISLITCLAIIKAHNGDITAHSLPASGACFKFTLPMG